MRMDGSSYGNFSAYDSHFDFNNAYGVQLAYNPFQIERCTFISTGLQGFYSDNFYNNQPMYNILRDNFFHSNGRGGLWWRAFNYYYTTQSFFERNTFNATRNQAAIYMYIYNNQLVMRNNIISHNNGDVNYYVIDITSIYSTYTLDFSFNEIYSNLGSSIIR